MLKCWFSFCAADFYVHVATFAKKLGIKTIMDSYKDVLPVLASGISGLKVNRMELYSLASLPKETSIETVALNLFSLYHMDWVAVTDGPLNAHLFMGNRLTGVRSLNSWIVRNDCLFTMYYH